MLSRMRRIQSTRLSKQHRYTLAHSILHGSNSLYEGFPPWIMHVFMHSWICAFQLKLCPHGVYVSDQIMLSDPEINFPAAEIERAARLDVSF